MRQLLASSLAVILIIPSLGLAQEGRWGIAVNESAKTCARYWEGSRCYQVTLPTGWVPLLPVWNASKNGLLLNYKDKDCLLGPSSAEQCCKSFGFSFDENSPARQTKTSLSMDPRSECYQLPESRYEKGMPRPSINPPQ